jgi:Na+-driven multidrug efflux pump
MGMVTYERKASFYQAGLNIILSIGLVHLYGFKGVLWGTVISSLLGSFYFLFMFHRHIFPYDLTSLFKNIYQAPLYAGALAGIFAAISNRYALSCFGSLNRINAAVHVLLVGILSFCVFSFTILQSKYFNRMELTRILCSISSFEKFNAKIVALIYGE